MQKYHDVVLDNNGNAVLSATITVTNNSDGTAATIYSDNGTTTIAGGTFTSSSVDGAYSFYAANGRYDIAITKTGFTTESLTDILLEDFTVAISVDSNNDVSIGGTVVSGSQFNLPQENDAVTPTLSFGDGDTGFFEVIDDELRVAIAGSGTFTFLALSFDGADTDGPRIANEVASSTNPTSTG